MWIINHDENTFMKLRELDFHIYNEKIGLMTNGYVFNADEVNRIIFNKWPENNPYYLIIDKISAVNLQALLILYPYLEGIAITTDLISKEWETIINFANSQNLIIYAQVKEKPKNNFENINFVEDIYAI